MHIYWIKRSILKTSFVHILRVYEVIFALNIMQELSSERLNVLNRSYLREEYAMSKYGP